MVKEISQNKTLRKELWATKTELMKIKDLLKPENEERATAYQINTLQTQLDESRTGVTKLVERIACYHKKGLEQKSNDVDVMEARIKALKIDLKTAKDEKNVS